MTMAKRSASSSATDLIEHLVPLRNDPDKLHEALARVDTVLFEDAFAQLLDVAASVKGTAEKRQKMVSTTPW